MAVRTGGREAVTLWEVLERYRVAAGQPGSKQAGPKQVGTNSGVASLLDCRLKSGRTHQIRVHLAAVGHPLLGDDTYGPGFRTKAALLSPAAQAALGTLSRQALHAYLLGIEHPASGKEMVFRSELPPELVRLRLTLGNG
jgi:23S rRNA pseudouridine1911/1915/1917 synthase